MKPLEPRIDRSLYQNRKDFGAETVYEITKELNGLPFGIAIADIEQSLPHSHKLTVETYTVVQGDIELVLDDVRSTLGVGDIARIDRGIVHSVRSLGDSAARITVTTIPEFSADDYYPATQ